jgi:hypothetical protein
LSLATSSPIFRLLLNCRRDFDDFKIWLSTAVALIDSPVLAEVVLTAVISGQISQTTDCSLHQIDSMPSRDPEAQFTDFCAASMRLHS